MPDPDLPSPTPGLGLLHVLRGGGSTVTRIAWSPDGQWLAVPSADGSVGIWDASSGACTRTLSLGIGTLVGVDWSPDSRRLAALNQSQGVVVWDVDSGDEVARFEVGLGYGVAWSRDGRSIAMPGTGTSVCVRDAQTGELLFQRPLTATMNALAWAPGDAGIAVGDNDGHVHLLDLHGAETAFEAAVEGYDENYCLAFSPDGRILATAGFLYAVALWDVASARKLVELQGHAGFVVSLSFSHDGRLLASKGDDGRVKIWRLVDHALVADLEEPAAGGPRPFRGLAFHPHRPWLATLGEADRVVRLWSWDGQAIDHLQSESIHYTTAKIVLVGDSGVGKTGLGWRLAHREFKAHASTHGQQFWAIADLGMKRADGTECEAVLWDLAGQHVYRQIHSIFLENVAVALVVFDPSNRQDPLKGVRYWLAQLKGNAELPPTVLVGGRVDRGAATISQDELDQFCQQHGALGGYCPTSATSSEGIEALLDAIKRLIPWDQMTATVTTATFKRIKDYVLELKTHPGHAGLVVTLAALRDQLQAADAGWDFSAAELATAVGHLETHGYVTLLRNSSGEQHVLLAPELLATLASSIILTADKHPRELGAVSETDLLQGELPFEELAGLAASERQLLIDAAILRFVEHDICFRESLGDQNLLVFPGLIKQRRPLQDDAPSIDGTSYVVRGRVANLYASLVVLLGHTPSFTRVNQWQNQAQYEMGEGEICGFRLIEDREGEIELVLYHGERLPPAGRAAFQTLFEEFLHRREVEVTRFPPTFCPDGHAQKRTTVIERVRDGKAHMHCDECGKRVALPDAGKRAIGIGLSPWLQREEAAARLRRAYEVALTKVKGYRRDWAAPRCHLSHAPADAAFARQLAGDLRDAGVFVVEDAGQVRAQDLVIVVDTPAYQAAFTSPADAAGAALVRKRLAAGGPLVALARSGAAAPHAFEACTPGSFCDDTHHAVGLFDLVLGLYRIPLDHAGFAPLRSALHRQWEQSRASTSEPQRETALKVFISYSHRDETFKDELVTMLAGLKRRGLIDAWQDRRIEPGDEWNVQIREAMDACDLALLLISADYLASRFIQEQEQPHLLGRRQDRRLRLMPIIVRPCPWQSEPALQGLQALPRDNRAVITFAKETGARDQVWTEIATAIEDQASVRARRGEP